MNEQNEQNEEMTIITWNEFGEYNAKEIGGNYEKKGMPILYHGKADEEDLIKIGKSYDACHLLHFIEDDEIIINSFKDEMGGYTVCVQVKDLINS